MRPKGDGRIYVPPSGHMAGIYARVDNTPRGAQGAGERSGPRRAGAEVQHQQGAAGWAEPPGRQLHPRAERQHPGLGRTHHRRATPTANGAISMCAARCCYLRESIDEGVQWAVFEPNDQNLWAKITRNVSAFLTTQWRLGMLFGSTAQEAFYVKCDAETNPPELREIGQVVTEIGVAIVRPAEFVIFRISQWQPPTAQLTRHR